MHNFFLGSSKKMFQLWNDLKLFSNGQLKEIEERIKSMEVPCDISRLPLRISSNSVRTRQNNGKIGHSFIQFTALKVFTRQAFQMLANICASMQITICQSVVSRTDLDIAAGLILKFCRSVEALYGKHVITPNIHLNNHLKEVIIDHRPVTSFWCFSFERFNAILGSTTTNKRSVELQLMRKLLISRQLKDMKSPNWYKEEFLGLCSPSGMSNSDITEEVYSHNTCVTHKFQTSIATKAPLHGVNWRNDFGVTLPYSYKLVSRHKM